MSNRTRSWARPAIPWDAVSGRWVTLEHDGCETVAVVVENDAGQVLSVTAASPRYGPRGGRLPERHWPLEGAVYWDGDLMIVPCPTCGYEDSVEVGR